MRILYMISILSVAKTLRRTYRATAFSWSIPFRSNPANRHLFFSGMIPPLIDVDCNLFHRDLIDFQRRQEPFSIINEDAIVESNIVAMLSPSSNIDEARRGLELSFPSAIKIRSTVGVHPYHVQDESLLALPLSQHIDQIRQLIQQHSPNVAAVGECGLDASDGFPPLDAQLPWFKAQVKLANELNLPLFVHERLAFQECMDLLEGASAPIIIHCFTGTMKECKAYIARGFSISLSGYLFKEEAIEVRQCLEDDIIPLTRLMIETDAPYMGFVGCRDAYLAKNAELLESLNSKKRKRLVNSIYPNLPSSLPQVLEKVLEHINFGRENRSQDIISREELALQLSRNANEFFQFGLNLA